MTSHIPTSWVVTSHNIVGYPSFVIIFDNLSTKFQKIPAIVQIILQRVVGERGEGGGKIGCVRQVL